MFDWNEEELANIIWGETGESDDHIVPYPEGTEDYLNKKEWSQEATKPAEQKTLGTKIDIHGRKLEGTSSYETKKGNSASGFCMDSWPDLSLSNAARADKKSMGAEVSNNLTEASKYDSSRGETVQLDKESEFSQNPHEGKEQGDIVDYRWANIGSFDDLDKIFSNDDPIFCDVSVGNADELWSSPKDATNRSVKSFPISEDSPSLGLVPSRNTSDLLETKTEYMQQDDQPFILGYVKTNDSVSHGVQNAHAVLDHAEYAGGENRPMVKEQKDMDMIKKTTPEKSCIVNEIVAIPEKTYRQKKKLLKCQKKLEENSENKALQDFYGTWCPPGNPPRHLENQLAHSVVQSCPSPVLSHQKLPLGPEFLQYQHISNPFVAPSAYGNLTNSYTAMPMLSHIQFGDLKQQSLLSRFEISRGNANPVNESTDTPAKPLTMTPQEKIEKLRRRQQMQALLAIQKQQQQFSHQDRFPYYSLTQTCPRDSQIQHVEGAGFAIKDLNALPSLDPNSPLEQDDSNTISWAVDDYSVEETILYQLQDVISKLDVRIRLCIRDSLFRLAQSAIQRQYSNDTSSANKSTRNEHEVVTKEEINSCNRIARMADVETETNPIDRSVAHLLFQRPLDVPGKHTETPESSASIILPSECSAAGLVNLQMGGVPESSKNKQNISDLESRSILTSAEPRLVDWFKNSSHTDTSKNVSNNSLLIVEL